MNLIAGAFIFSTIFLCLQRGRNPLTILAIFSIYFYKYAISPLKPKCCVYEQTCSEYALEMLRTRTLIRAAFLITIRLLSCHPIAKNKFTKDSTEDKIGEMNRQIR